MQISNDDLSQHDSSRNPDASEPARPQEPGSEAGTPEGQAGDSRPGARAPRRDAGTAGSLRPQLPALVFLAVLVFLGVFPRLLMAPMLVQITRELAITTGQATRLFLFVSAGYTALMLLSGFVSQRLGHRKTLVVSAAGTGAGALAISVAGSLPVMQGAAVLLGAGAGLYAPSGIPTVVALVSAENRGKALAIHEMGPNLAVVSAPLVVAALVPAVSWRLVFAVTGLICLTAAGAYARWGRGSELPGEPPNLKNIATVLADPAFWVVAALLTVAVSAAVGVYAILPSFLIEERALDARLVNTLIGVSRASGIAMVFLTGIAVDRIGVRRMLTIVCSVVGVFTLLLGVAHGPLLIAAVLLQPLLVPAFFPTGLSAIAQVGPPHLRNLAVALVIPAANFFGTGVFPSFAGLLAEQGRFAWAFVVLAAVLFASLALVARFRPQTR